MKCLFRGPSSILGESDSEVIPGVCRDLAVRRLVYVVTMGEGSILSILFD